MTVARNHHFISQCYLKGFAKNRSKKSKLFVIDSKEKKSFYTTPRNVGSLRDFNRVDFANLDQNALEKEISEFEGLSSKALEELDGGEPFVRERREAILILAVFFAVRRPDMREKFKEFHEENFKDIIDSTLARDQSFLEAVSQLQALGSDVDLDYYKNILYKKHYEITRNRHIETELKTLVELAPIMMERKWSLIQSNEETGPFITSDNPVALTWIEPDSVPEFYRDSPGFGLNGTQVYFPISAKYAAIGEFGGEEKIGDANKEFVAILNTKIMYFANRQIYAPTEKFYFMKDGVIMNGNRVLEEICA